MENVIPFFRISESNKKQKAINNETKHFSITDWFSITYLYEDKHRHQIQVFEIHC